MCPGQAKQLGQVWLGLDEDVWGLQGPCPPKVRTCQRCLWIRKEVAGLEGPVLDPAL